MNLSRFAVRAPFPILRVTPHVEDEKRLMVGAPNWSNHSSQTLLEYWAVATGESRPSDWRAIVRDVARSDKPHREALPLADGVRKLTFVHDLRKETVYAFDHTCAPQSPTDIQEGRNFVANMGHEQQTRIDDILVQTTALAEVNGNELLATLPRDGVDAS